MPLVTRIEANNWLIIYQPIYPHQQNPAQPKSAARTQGRLGTSEEGFKKMVKSMPSGLTNDQVEKLFFTAHPEAPYNTDTTNTMSTLQSKKLEASFIAGD